MDLPASTRRKALRQSMPFGSIADPWDLVVMPVTRKVRAYLERSSRRFRGEVERRRDCVTETNQTKSEFH